MVTLTGVENSVLTAVALHDPAHRKKAIAGPGSP